MTRQLHFLLFVVFSASSILAEEPKWQFEDVTAQVVDKNPPGSGPDRPDPFSSTQRNPAFPR